MRFLIDVDGVVADLITTMIDDINQAHRKYKTRLNPEHITDFYFMNPDLGILSPGECKFAIRNFARPGLAYELQPIPSAVEGVQKLENAGHEVVFVTSDWQESRTWVNDRRAWISEHFGDQEVIFCHKKHYVIGDVLIDDRAKTCETFATAHPEALVLMYDQPWNRDHLIQAGNIQQFNWGVLDYMLEHNLFPHRKK